MRRKNLKVGENEFDADELTADEAENLAERGIFGESRRRFLERVAASGIGILAAQQLAGCNSDNAGETENTNRAQIENAEQQGGQQKMKIIALEEHFVTSAMREAWRQLPPSVQDIGSRGSEKPELKSRLEDFAELRIKEMDAGGVDVQVLSPTAPGVQNLEPPQAVKIARQTNDFAAEIIKKQPDRFEAFATLPTPDPREAAKELERAINELKFSGAVLYGRTGTRYLDHADFLPIFETAARLRAPIYIHPQTPLPAVREIYYSGFSKEVSDSFASSGWGWHLETGIQAVRLILSGVFDRFPDLQIILGHWGEGMTFYLDRIDELSKFAKNLKKPVADYARENFYITPSGIFSPNYLKWALDVMGRERIMFSTDYPYKIAPGRGARDYIEKSGLDSETQNPIAGGNWQRLTAQIKRENSSRSATDKY